MPHRLVVSIFVLTLVGCAHLEDAPPASTAAPGGSAGTYAPSESPLGSPFGTPVRRSSIGTPLLIDRTDTRIGTTVQFRHVPSPTELHDLQQLPGLSRVVLSFESWPLEYAPIQSLNQAPSGVEMIVVLQGWPPNRASIDAWNYLNVPLRVIVLVPGPPPSIDLIQSLNEMRALERVIAEMDEPSRQGFERLQRPLNFRKLVD